MDSNLLVMLVSRSVPDIKCTGLVSGRILQKCPVRFPAGLLTKSGRTNIFSIFRFYCHRYLSTIVQNVRQFDAEEKCLSFKHSMA